MDSIKLRTVFGSKTVIFNLKVLTVAEENRIRASTFGLTEKEQEETGFENIVSALAEFSAEDVEVTDTEGKRNDKITVREYFKDCSPSKERIANTAFRAWMVALQPTYDFL